MTAESERGLLCPCSGIEAGWVLLASCAGTQAQPKPVFALLSLCVAGTWQMARVQSLMGGSGVWTSPSVHGWAGSTGWQDTGIETAKRGHSSTDSLISGGKSLVSSGTSQGGTVGMENPRVELGPSQALLYLALSFFLGNQKPHLP